MHPFIELFDVGSATDNQQPLIRMLSHTMMVRLDREMNIGPLLWWTQYMLVLYIFLWGR